MAPSGSEHNWKAILISRLAPVAVVPANVALHAITITRLPTP